MDNDKTWFKYCIKHIIIKNNGDLTTVDRVFEELYPIFLLGVEYQKHQNKNDE